MSIYWKKVACNTASVPRYARGPAITLTPLSEYDDCVLCLQCVRTGLFFNAAAVASKITAISERSDEAKVISIFCSTTHEFSCL